MTRSLSWLTALSLIVIATPTTHLSATHQAAAPSPSQGVKMPLLVGLPLDSVTRLLPSVNLRLGSVVRVTDTARAGLVIRQSPPPNSYVRPGTAVEVSISIGSNRTIDTVTAGQEPVVDLVRVPDLMDSTMAEAARLLRRAGLRLAPQDSIPTGVSSRIVRQQPLPREWVAKGSVVRVWLGFIGPVVVPNLVGRTIPEAIAALEPAGLILGRVESAPVDSEEGRIIRQAPPARQAVTKGSHIDIVVGVERLVMVPKVTGSEISQAITILRNAGLSEGARTTVESDATPGTVLSQRPQAGTQVARQSLVDLQVAIPVRTVTVPDLSGKTPAQAYGILDAQGLRLGRVSRVEGSQTIGLVVRQDPAMGTKVPRGTDVAIWVTTGQKMIPVPNVVGRTEVAAAALLQTAELSLGAVKYVPRPGGDSTIEAQLPAAASFAPRGTSVAVDVAIPIPVVHVAVPNLVGHSRSEGEMLLGAVGLVLGAVTTFDSVAGNDTVLSQNPIPGTLVTSGTAVSIQVVVLSRPDTTLDAVVQLPNDGDSSREAQSKIDSNTASRVSNTGGTLPPNTSGGAEVPGNILSRLWDDIGTGGRIGLIIIGSTLTIGAGAVGISRLRQLRHLRQLRQLRQLRIDRRWRERMTLEPHTGTGHAGLPADASPLTRPEMLLVPKSDPVKSHVVGDHPVIQGDPI